MLIKFYIKIAGKNAVLSFFIFKILILRDFLDIKTQNKLIIVKDNIPQPLSNSIFKLTVVSFSDFKRR